MKITNKSLYASLLAILLIAIPEFVLAQSYRYEDESGNIYHVDSPNKIPPKYRIQIMPTPTPEVFIQTKGGKSAQKKKEKLERKKREREEKQREKEERKRNKKKKKGVLADGPTLVGAPGATYSDGSPMPVHPQLMNGPAARPNKSKSGVEVFVASQCPDCDKLMRFMKENKIHYQKMNVERGKKAAEAYKEMKVQGLPVTRIGNSIILGFQPNRILSEMSRQGL